MTNVVTSGKRFGKSQTQLERAIAERDKAQKEIEAWKRLAENQERDLEALEGKRTPFLELVCDDEGLELIDENGDSVDIQEVINERNQAIAERDAAREKLERVIRETGWHPLKRWRGSLTDAKSPDDGRNAVLAGDPGDKVDNLREALQTLLSWESGDD